MPGAWRYTLAALVYFCYGLLYFFGAHYLTNTQATERAMSNAQWFFAIGALLVVLLPWLIYQRCALAVSWCSRRARQRKTLSLDFTLLLGCLVSMRVIGLIVHQAHNKTPLHQAALLMAILTALCLLWAGASRPGWMSRETLDAPLT